jgi:hypothetical protein
LDNHAGGIYSLSALDADGLEVRNLRLLGEYCSDVIAKVDASMAFSYISTSVERICGWPVERNRDR